ncbi:DoxX family protein [Glycocaulis abyssi]|uniref:DoxX family protein n=1 Tax=Glycocaulis abyssi TaxID=1433403 RepID=A0ABV9N8D9_9PROT
MHFDPILTLAGLSPVLNDAIHSYSGIAMGLGAPIDVLSFVARFVVGFMFFWAGYTKLFRPDRRRIMHQTLREAGIPLPWLNTWFVSASEFVFGFLFLVGAFTLLSGAVLAVITFVAFMTVGRKHIEWGGPFFSLSGLLYNSEIMILVFIALVALFGPGALSVDAAIWQDAGSRQWR